MANVPSDRGLNASDPSSARGRDRIVVIVIAGAGFVAGALVGAYLNWVWWEIGYRPLATIIAVAILVIGGVVSMLGREMARRSALVVLAVGFGVLAGQYLGPGREPLIDHSPGTMTLRLGSPFIGVTTGSADCTNVASATEILVHGALDQPHGQLGSPDGVAIQLGDRWAVPRDTSRRDRVRLEIWVTTQLVPGSIKVLTRIGMEATASSTLESTFSREGGSIRFADLVALGGPGFTGESMDLAGTLEWTCGPPLP
jgi:hypothetical protein